MKRPFIHDDFLLETETARILYHEVAKTQPIYDYHCHLSPEQIARNHQFRSLTELWLSGDHYKWRAMRANGISERFVTGDASDSEKFAAWARTVPATLRNPLYHWTHLELRNPFGITDRLLDGDTAAGIYEECNARLAEPAFRTQGLLRHFDVAVVCTTDDPADTLEHHSEYAAAREKAGQRGTRLFPTFRPDRVLAVEAPATWNEWLERLGAAADVSVGSYERLLEALQRRHAYFHEVGCRLSDHGLETAYAEPCTHGEATAIFDKARRGEAPTRHEAVQWRSVLLYELALMDHARGWVQQFHIGALRNNNTRLLNRLGADTGFDSIGDEPVALPLSRFLDRLDSTDQLAKTVLYNLNPRDNELFATMIGNFQDGSMPGKMQYGSAWWFLDQLDGMERQLNALSNMGLLSRFVGMLTDSRSFLSYSRHEYFRRLLCNLLGNDVRRGLLPDDRGLLAELVRCVCFVNAKQFFGLS